MIKRDLAIVVADLDAENVIKKLLCGRQPSLGIRLDFNPNAPPPVGDLLRYNGRDAGCYKNAVSVLRVLQRSHRHAMIIFDRDGCGADDKPREMIEEEIEHNLHRSGWAEDTVSAIVIEPELEVWVWATSPRVADALGWRNDANGLRAFLSARNLWNDQDPKPNDPKEAMMQALREKKSRPLGAPLFAELAATVGLSHCQDRAFMKFHQILTQWFGISH